MVLPGSESVERGKVYIDMLPRPRSPPNTMNVHSNHIVINVDNIESAHAVLEHTQHVHHHPVKEPDCTCCVQPHFVAEFALEANVDMILAAGDDEDSEEDMDDEEYLIRLTTHVEVASHQHNDDCHCGDATPDPIRKAQLFRVCPIVDIESQCCDGMDDGLEPEDAGDPAVQQHEGGVRPVAQPKEHVVAASEQNDQRCQCKTQRARSDYDILEYFLVLAREPSVWLCRFVVDCSEDNVQYDHEGNVGSMADRRCDSNQIFKRTDSICTDETLPSDVRPNLVRDARHERQISHGGEKERCCEAGDEDDDP